MAVSRSIRSSGSHPPGGSPSEVCRVIATAIPSSGLSEVTGQSLPKLTLAPLANERADRVLPCAPLLAESRNGQLHHRRVELSPDRFEVGDHVESGEAANVIGMDQLGMGDGRPPIPMPVLGDRRLDGVEGVADPGVADGMDVDLKAVAIERQRQLRAVLPASSWRSRGSRDGRNTRRSLPRFRSR